MNVYGDETKNWKLKKDKNISYENSFYMKLFLQYNYTIPTNSNLYVQFHLNNIVLHQKLVV